MDSFFQQLAVNDSVLNINLNKNGQTIAALQRELVNYDNKQISRLVEDKLPNAETRYQLLVESFLRYCQQVNPWSLMESIDLVMSYYQYLATLQHPLFRETTDLIVPWLKKTGHVTFITTVLSKLFNNIKSTSQNELLLYIANKLNNVYFYMDSSSSCGNIFKNVNHKLGSQKFSHFPKSQQVEFRYLLGRYYLSVHRTVDAYYQLHNAYRDLPAAMAMSPNALRILRFLVPAGMILGKIPKLDVLTRFPELQIYIHLCQYLIKGDVFHYNMWIKENEQYFVDKKILLLLLEKSQDILYRNLLRRIQSHVRSNKLPYHLLERGFAVSIKPTDELSIYRIPYNVENILVTLINLGYLRGNIFPVNKVLVTMKSDDMRQIYPEINGRILSKHHLNSEDKWMD